MRLYAITLKSLIDQKMFAKEECWLDYCFYLIQQKVAPLGDWKLTDVVYEKDSRGRLHLHGILHASEYIVLTKCNLKGITTKFKPLHSYPGWKDYMAKQYRIDQAEWKYRSMKEYLFDSGLQDESEKVA